MGLIGRGGMVGVSVILGGGTTPNQAVVQIAGGAFRIKAKFIKEELERSGKLRSILLCYTQSLLTQISQTAVCNRLHTVDQHLCRWLLINHDQLETNKLVMTQELIANMLGVRREGVTIAAQKLQKKRLIKYVRGTITMLDRNGLEEAACECYQIVMMRIKS